MAKADAERNLLSGILAMQMNFVTREALIAAVSAWVLDKQKPLGEILVEQGGLSPAQRVLLESLVEEHLKQHGNDPSRSLAMLNTIGPARRALEGITDRDVQASLAVVSAACVAADDPSATLTPRLPALHGPERPGVAADDPSATLAPPMAAAVEAPVRFRILRPHARGGLGEVFVAHDEELNRDVALKQLREQHADRPESRCRFLLEAEITGALEHPGIVPVYALGTDSTGRPFYVMRFIQGETLTAAIKRYHCTEGRDRDPGARTLAFRKLLSRFIDVCNAVAYAHSKGVLHRDLKPDNIMLGKYDETLVVDWGLAKAHGRPDLSVSSDEEPVLPASGGSGVETLPGRAFGTPQFMSPEQADGKLERMGPACDGYSLGATLYVLLTGRVAFEGSDLGQVIQEVLRGEFPPPRQVLRDVPKALEAVCLKAMAHTPEDRYASPRALADDIERWLADEPVSAMREPAAVKVRRWVGRHQPLVTSGATALLMAVLAGGYFLYDVQLRAAQRRIQADGRVEALATADIREVPSLLRQLQSDRHLVLDHLREMARTAPPGPDGERRRLHAALALLPDEPAQAAVLARRLLRPDSRPEELFVIRQALRDHRPAATPPPEFRAALETADFDLTDPQLRAAGALALFDAQDPRWEDLGQPIAAKLVREDPLLIGAWREVFQPISRWLTEPLRIHFGCQDQPDERVLAGTLLFAFASRSDNPNQPEDLADLVAGSDPVQFQQILGQLKDRPRFVARLEAQLGKPAQFNVELARHQGQMAAALVVLNQAGRAWPLLVHSIDPGVRTELIHDLAKFGADPHAVIRRLNLETDVSARRALIRSLGEFPTSGLSAGERKVLVSKLLAWYRDDTDPGVHGAIDWLLRQRWEEGAELDRLDRDLAGPELPAKRDWYVNGQGQTFVLVRGPVEFQMGSPETDGQREHDEIQHRRRVGRSFAIATKELTRAQFARFLDRNRDLAPIFDDEEIRKVSPTASCPQVYVNWPTAARYCNWLSQEEEIPEDQWCYPTEIRPGMAPPVDSLKRTGYRLPTEAEWEYACRAGTMSSRPYGSSEALLADFGWYLANAGRQVHPTGQKKPNDLGLFDMLGNVKEWTQNPYRRYHVEPDNKPSPDDEMPVVLSDDTVFVLRGGSFSDAASNLRSADRNADQPTSGLSFSGLRPARTCP